MRRRWWRLTLGTVLAAHLARGAAGRGLKAFVEDALAHDLGYQSAVASSTLGEAQWRAARASFLPKVVPVASYSRDESGSSARSFGLGVSWDTGFGASLVGSYTRSDLGATGTSQSFRSTDRSVQVTVPLGAQFGRLPAKLTLESSRATRDAAARTLKDARQQAILQIVRTYFAYLQAVKAAEVAGQSVDRARRNHETTLMKYSLGEISRIDLDRAQQLLQQTRITAVTADNEVARIRSEIENVYGATDISTYFYESPPTDAFVLPWTDEEIIAKALAANPAIASAREQLEVAKLSLRLAWRQLLPTIDANYRVGTRDTGAPAAGAPASSSYHQLSLTSNLSLDYSDRRLALLGAQVSLRTQELALRQLEQNLRSNLESQLQSFANKRALIDLSRRSLETSRGQTELAKVRFEKGIGSAFDVVDSQAQLQSTELQFLAAEVDFILSFYQILYQLQVLDLDRLIE